MSKYHLRILLGVILALLVGSLLALPIMAQDDSTCTVTAIDGAVLRSGPGIIFETAGALGAGESRDVIRQEADELGQTWWRITNGAWIREDLVTESAGCDTFGEEEDMAQPEGSADECIVTTIDGAVLRSGPSTDLDTAGVLGAGESRNVIRQEIDELGQTWWRLSQGGWVREDLVTESAGCDTLGEEEGASSVDAATDECVVTAINGANLRREPNADSDAAGVLGADESRNVIRQAVDALGQTWWRLSQGGWVREDLVTESVGCDTLGEEEDMEQTEGSTSECEVTAIDGAVLRSGPGTDFETDGALGADETRIVIRSELNADGRVWWRLSNGAWVREDLVLESAGCDTLGEEDGTPQSTGSADECEVTAIDGAVLRSGPGTDFETDGALGADETRTVTRSELNVDGRIWWRLSNGAWVREDLVLESAGCDSLE